MRLDGSRRALVLGARHLELELERCEPHPFDEIRDFFHLTNDQETVEHGIGAGRVSADACRIVRSKPDREARMHCTVSSKTDGRTNRCFVFGIRF